MRQGPAEERCLDLSKNPAKTQFLTPDTRNRLTSPKLPPRPPSDESNSIFHHQTHTSSTHLTQGLCISNLTSYSSLHIYHHHYLLFLLLLLLLLLLLAIKFSNLASPLTPIMKEPTHLRLQSEPLNRSQKPRRELALHGHHNSTGHRWVDNSCPYFVDLTLNVLYILRSRRITAVLFTEHCGNGSLGSGYIYVDFIFNVAVQ